MVWATLSLSPNSSLLTPKNPRATYFYYKICCAPPPTTLSLCLPVCLPSPPLLFSSHICQLNVLCWLPATCSPPPSHHHLPPDFSERTINCKAFEKPAWGKTQDDAGSLSIPFTCPSPLFYKIAPSFDTTHISIQKHTLTWAFFQHRAVLQ